MRSTRHAAAACALGLALLVPAIPLTAQEADQPAPDSARPTLTPSNVSPDAALTAAESDGTIAEILVSEGEEIDTGAVIARLS